MQKCCLAGGLLWLLPLALWAQAQPSELTRQALAKAAPPYRWIAEQRVRGAYYSALSELSYYDTAAGAGINCILNKSNGFIPASPEAGLNFHADQATICAARGMKYIAYVNFSSDTERSYTKRQYTPVVDAAGTVYPNSPSPLDRGFWDQAIKQRWLLLAERAKTAPITGTAIDFEMYGSEIIFYDRIGCLDYSDLAFNGFLQDRKLTLDQPVPLAQRAAWLKERNLTAAYEAYYRQTLESICRDIEQAVHRVNPDFLIGFYSWSNHSMFYEACARGFGTEQRPVLLWPGSTYSTGYTKFEVDDQVSALAQIGAHAVFIPGLWLWQFDPQNLAANAYLCGQKAGGYWLYGVYATWEETARRRKVPHVDGPAYWAALKQADDDIAAAQKDPNYQSALKVDLSRSLFLSVDPTQLAAPARLQPLAAAVPPPVPVDKQKPCAPARGDAVYRAWGLAGSQITFRVHSVHLPPHTNGTVASVLGPDQKLLAEERVGMDETKDLIVPCAAAGVYTLVTQSSNLCSTVACDAPYFVLDAGAGLHLMTAVEPALYFLVPAGVTEFTITGRGQGIERFCARIVGPDGAVAADEKNISAPTALTVKVPAGQDGQAWTLQLSPPTEGPLEDVGITLSKNLPPYLARDKARLLVLEPAP
ncbi:hypothetical protein LLH23_22050 [bacterium]|nr:hypothetical protein [bacterium]